ncbi:hypothetical protein D3C79_1027440 [compost metagenome]
MRVRLVRDVIGQTASVLLKDRLLNVTQLIDHFRHADKVVNVKVVVDHWEFTR